MARNRGAASDVDRNSAQSIDCGETILVGGVVADEHRQTPVEWRINQKLCDRAALAGRPRHQLDHHLARDRGKRAAACLHCLLDECTTTRRQRRCLPVVEGEAAALVFKKDAVMLCCEAGNRWTEAVE